MNEKKIKQIEEEGKKLIDDFSKSLEKIEEKIKEIKDENMTWYANINTVTRNDRNGVKKNFKECLKRNAPKWENGYVKVD